MTSLIYEPPDIEMLSKWHLKLSCGTLSLKISVLFSTEISLIAQLDHPDWHFQGRFRANQVKASSMERTEKTR